MILAWLIIIPIAGGLAAWAAGRRSTLWPRWLSLTALLIDAALFIILWNRTGSASALSRGTWLAELVLDWIPQFGIGIHLAMDGLSLVLVGLTLFLGILSILCSWSEIRDRVGFFHMNVMAILAGIIGVFLSLDLFLFYFFWELMLVPMYFLIAIWGHEDKQYASLKFFIFTQAGGLFMLISILALFFIHYRNTGVPSFDYALLLGTSLHPVTSLLLMAGFLVAFAVKLPMVPFHPWLPDAHTQAPTAGSVILAGLLLKTGAYGIIRFVLPLFPLTVPVIAPAMQAFGVLGILYGAFLSFAQTDLKRLVAYTSVSHMGFVLLGIFAMNTTSLQGSVMQMLAHGISTGALFIIVGLLQERMHTRDMERMGGLWSMAPRLSGTLLIFGLAALGLPGFGNFVAEFLVLLGTWRVSPPASAIAAAGLVLSALYALRMVQRTVQGEQRWNGTIPDLSSRETGVLVVMIVTIIWLGLHPGQVLDMTRPAVSTLQFIPLSEDRLDADAGRVQARTP